MIVEELNKYIETIAGYVFDNDKLVTYKWLSKELQIHVNLAKQVLWEFYQKYHKDNIECTYLLIGHLKDNGMRMEVVKESALSKAKDKFSQIISEHLYSVHKPLGDLNLLASEFSGAGDINYSAIKCDACKERSDEEIQLLRWGTATKKFTTQDVNSKFTNLINSSKSEKNSVTAKKNKFNNFFNMPGKSKSPEELKFEKTESLMEKDKNLSKEKDSIKINSCSTEKNGASVVTVKGLIKEEKYSMGNENDSLEEDKVFFKDKNSKEKIKNSIKKKEDSKVNSKKISPKSNSVKKEGLDNFFKKLTSPPKPAEVISLVEKSDKIKKTSNEEGKTKEKEKNNLHRKKRNRSKETNENVKKRKRVFVQSDSSDSEVQSDVEMEESILEPEPESHAKAKSPSPPRIKHENGKRKVLKLVNKTYKEGDYIVTKKEHVYVSCSEDEEEKKEEEKRRNVKKMECKMEKVKKKQSTLTDFFKKS